MAQIPEEHQMLQELVAKFVDQELMPLEKNVLEREASGGVGGLTEEEQAPLLEKCKELGLWALDAPEEVGGADLPAMALVGVNFELGRTCVPFTFPPDAPNMHMLVKVANEEQKRKYLDPYVKGEASSAIAISEPGAGGDPAEMKTRAVKEGDEWVINGRKIWVSRIPKADFTILMALTDPEKKARGGITAFIVEKDTPGFIVEREIKMLAGARTYELVFDNLRLPESQILGEIGNGFGPMQHRLTIRRLQMGAWCVGMANRALQMMCEHAQQRHTFGSRLAEKQAVQWWIADAATKIHAAKLMVLDAAEKQDAGEDLRTEASMIKLYATEMVGEIVDHAMQAFGAMGMTKELPLQLMAQRARLMRIYEGPSEVHRMVIARRTLRQFG
ncbi:MAG TPA: acyl-CoA dehydrogenase family protein [Alphaproteobacteria bacterium]|nr:acyl-CoA dehydrogenase family protein [Alphaproteobacteria bacterium]